MALFLEPFKAVAAEGAVVELKLRLLAGKVPALQKYAHKKELGEIETDLVKHFDGSLSAQEKETLRLCRQLRNKVPHSDFRAARGKLNELGVETQAGGVVKIDLPAVTVAELSKKFSVSKQERKACMLTPCPWRRRACMAGLWKPAARGIFRRRATLSRGQGAIVDRLSGV